MEFAMPGNIETYPPITAGRRAGTDTLITGLSRIQI